MTLSPAAARAADPPKTHNQQSDNEAIIALHLGKIAKAQAAFATETGALRGAFAQAASHGLNLKAAKNALKIIKSGKVDEYLEEITATILYLKVRGHGVTDSQLSLDLGSSLAPIEEKAALEGRAAGWDEDKGESDNPHAINTKAGQAWLKSFRDGRAQLRTLEQIKPLDPANDDDAAADDEEGDD
jgi:hypothetical protein